MQDKITISFPYGTQEEFEEKQKEIIKETIQEIISISSKKQTCERYMTRKQVAESLHISLVTLHHLTTEGTIPGYRLKGRVLYKVEDIQNALQKIEPMKFMRGKKDLPKL